MSRTCRISSTLIVIGWVQECRYDLDCPRSSGGQKYCQTLPTQAKQHSLLLLYSREYGTYCCLYERHLAGQSTYAGVKRRLGLA